MDYNEIQQQVLLEIRNHKALVERIADENLIKLLYFPEVKKLYDIIKDTKRELIASSNKNDVVKLEQKVSNIRQDIIKFAQNHGFKKSDFVAQYWCKKCKDSGLDNSYLCQCVKTKTAEINMQQGLDTNIGFDKANFDIFDNKEFVKSLYNKAQTFIDKLETTKFNNFTILGGVGVGKTYLLQCMSRYALEKNKYVIYLSAFRLNEIFLNYYTSPMSEKNKILKPLLDCELLCIDDLGCEQLLNNVTVPMLTMLINERNSAGRKTAITSNLSINEIRERYDYRLCSRLVDTKDSIIFMFEGIDLRQKR